MNSDIRVSVNFWKHLKTLKLIWKLGYEGAVSLQKLWIWAATNRPDGNLVGMSEEDVEIVAEWYGEKGDFILALCALHWIDGVSGEYCLHDWNEHNPWCAKDSARSDKARMSKLAQIRPELYKVLKAQGVTAITKQEYEQYIAEIYPSGASQPIASETPGPSTSTSPGPGTSTGTSTSTNTGTNTSTRPQPPAPAPAPMATAAPPVETWQEAQEKYRQRRRRTR